MRYNISNILFVQIKIEFDVNSARESVLRAHFDIFNVLCCRLIGRLGPGRAKDGDPTEQG